MTRADHLISLVLAEDRMPAMQAKWADKLNTSHDTRLTLSNDQHVRAHAALRHLHDMDPTPNKQYMGKLVDWYHRGQFRVEDKDRISNAVKDFHSLKNRLKPEHAGPEVANPKDIGSYPSIHHLERAVKAVGTPVETPWTKTTESQRQAVKAGSNIVHDDADLTVRAVHTHDAMKVLGSNTSWCVVPDKATFDDYREQGPLFLPIALTNYDRVSINSIAWLGSEFHKADGYVAADEEHWLAVHMPKQLSKPNCLLGTTLCSHFAFGPQREHMDQTDVLDLYRALIRKGGEA